MLAPRTHPGPTIKLDKCSVVVGDPACSETVLQLPRQVWRPKNKNIIKDQHSFFKNSFSTKNIFLHLQKNIYFSPLWPQLFNRTLLK